MLVDVIFSYFYHFKTPKRSRSQLSRNSSQARAIKIRRDEESPSETENHLVSHFLCDLMIYDSNSMQTKVLDDAIINMVKQRLPGQVLLVQCKKISVFT